MTNEEEYHLAMHLAYAKQHPVEVATLKVYANDLKLFYKLCRRYNQSPPAMFHTLLKSNV